MLSTGIAEAFLFWVFEKEASVENGEGREIVSFLNSTNF
jgi:hypothetical protein